MRLAFIWPDLFGLIAALCEVPTNQEKPPMRPFSSRTLLLNDGLYPYAFRLWRPQG